MSKNKCCFVDCQSSDHSEDLHDKLEKTILKLIFLENTDTFIFCDKTRFSSMCYNIVTDIKLYCPFIKRVYMCNKVCKKQRKYLLQFFEEIHISDSDDIINEMIGISDCCLYS